MPPKSRARHSAEQCILVLQGGGALGAYQGGVYETLEGAGLAPTWLAGISIGAINAALIAGNAPERRVERLREFWEGVSTLPFGIEAPQLPEPLKRTLERMVDFDRINSGGVRLSVGAVNVRSGNFLYFDSRERAIDVRHIMASAALPPGFPPIEIDGEFYWDGGLVSNTPLQHVLDQPGSGRRLVFQVDLFPARGEMPSTIGDAAEREKDIRYSSRTRLNTTVELKRQAMLQAAQRIVAKLPPQLRNDPDAKALARIPADSAVTVVHLIYRTKHYESQSKDYEFSRASMLEHWSAGVADTTQTLADPRWQHRKPPASGVEIFDLTAERPLAATVTPEPLPGAKVA